MRYLFFCLFIGWITSFAQVYNFGANEITFKNLLNNGVTYVKTGNAHFDSVFISQMEQYWTITDFSVVEQYKRPDKSSTALFITTKELTRKYMMDRKNQHVMVLQPAEIYVPRKSVKMEETLGYMYLNGFYDLVEEKDEYRFNYMVLQALHQGLAFIKKNNLTGEPELLNQKVATLFRGTDAPSAGNILILNREQTRHAVDIELLDKYGINYRLLAEKEYYKTVQQKKSNHVLLYFAHNRFSELGLFRLSDGKLLYTKHFREDYPTISKKEWKELSVFFQ